LVNSGVILTIDPGVTVKFNPTFYLKIQGQIIASGTQADSITFTSNNSSPNMGAWSKIWLISTSTNFDGTYNYVSGSIFKYCKISYAQEGIRVDDAQINVSNSSFSFNTIGVSFKKINNSLFFQNNFYNNSDATNTNAGTEDNGVGSFTYVNFISNIFFNNTNNALSFGGYRNNSNNNLIKGNTVKNNGGVGLNFQWGDVVTGFSNNIIEKNIVYNNGSDGIIICRDNNIIRKNIILKNNGNGIGISGTYIFNGLTINNNIISLNNKSAIDLSSNNNSDVYNNQILNSGKAGISPVINMPSSYVASTNDTISNNLFYNSKSNDFEIFYGPNVINSNNFLGLKADFFIKILNKAVFTINATGNYWGTTSQTTIDSKIYDNSDDFELGTVLTTSKSNSILITPPISPVSNITKLLVDGNVVLTWTDNPEADKAGYKIYYGGYTGYSYTNVIDAGNVLSYTLPAGVSIDEDIAVTAYDASKDGTDDQFDGNESWYSPANKAPAIAVISTIIPTERQVQLNWGAVTNANKYNIYKSTDSATFTLLTSVKGTAYTDATLNTLQQRYFYKVAAFDSLDLSYDNYGLEGPHSAIKGAKPTNKPTISSVESFTDVIKLNFSYNSNLAGITSVKVYRSSPTQDRALVATLAASATTFTNTVVNDIPYSYDVTITNATDESDKSDVIIASSFSVPVSVSPIADQLDIKTTQIYKWSKNATANRYLIQFDTVNSFNSAALIEKSLTDTSTVIQDLIQNQYYFWRIKTGDANGFSNWSSVNRFQSYVKEATIDNVIAANKNDTLKFTIPSIKNISKIYILRDTVDNPVKIIDSISNVTSIVYTYIDTLQLKLNQKYFYSLQLFNSQGIKSSYSTSKNATPFNTRPKTASLENKVFNNVGEYNFVRSTYSSLGSKDLDGKIVNYNWYVNDSLVNSTDSILIYYYNQGTNDLKLVITDNDGAKDSTTAKVTLNAFLKTFKGGLLGGVTALNPNKIYTADSTFDPVNGASILMLDRLGNTIYPLVVSSKIFTTPSVSSDSSVFITSGSSLNGFSKTGAPLWSTIPLGGNSFVTPTIDSLLTRIYLGVSNKNFFAIDYNTGKVAWNISSDAPINTSAVITGDRKLVFISQLGTLYGYDIRSNIAHTASKWKYSIGEIVTKSPAVDGGNNLYIGTDAGNLIKLTLKEDSSVTKVWSIKLKGAIQTSAVIDGDGFVYIGDEVGDFYKINPNDGSIIWTYSSGAAIRSTPAISDFGSIYFANMNGLVTAIDSNKSIKWKYKDTSPISANLLYINNMIYAGTESGKFFAIFDNPTTKTVNTTLSVAGTEIISKVSNIKSFSTSEIAVPKIPVWGTFQGNYRRTGSRNFDCPDKPVIKIPSCVQNADSIRVSTDNMKQRYWLLNEVKLETIDTVLFIKPSDKIKLIAYNSNGCNVSSVETAAIPNSDVPKPIIVTNTGTDKFCQTDSIIMSSKLNAKSYQWNYAGFPISNAKSKTLVTNLSGAYSVTLVNDYGCKSTSDISLIMAIQKPSAPIISRDTSGGLISSSVTGNQWYKEGLVITGATSRLYKPSSPGIFNVSSNNQGCMSTLSTPYYFIVTNVINLGSNEFIKLAPNPVKNQMNIDFVIKGYQRLNIDFYELSTGLLKYSNKGVFAGSQLYLGQLSPGTYVVSVRSEDGKVAHKLKIVKL
jgi:parallel beta-helix repeat protein